MSAATVKVNRPSLGGDTITAAFTDPALVPDIVEDIGARMVFVAAAMRRTGDTNGLCPVCGHTMLGFRELVRHLVAEHQINNSYIGERSAALLEGWEQAAAAWEAIPDES